jgi:hypothetical protein
MGVEDDLSKEEYAFNLTELDKWTLLQTDEEFKKHDWEDLKRIIGESIFYTPYYHDASVCGQ